MRLPARTSLVTRIGRRDQAIRARAEAAVLNPPPINYLLASPFDVNVTRMDRTPFGPAPGRDNQLRTGPLVTVEIPFQLVGAAPAKVIASADPNRKQLMLQNKDPIENLFYSFGVLATENSKFIAPGVTILLDIHCPTDRISVFSTANVSGALSTVSPMG